MQRNPKIRIGSGQTDAEEIKKHPFFSSINFKDLLKRHLSIPPIIFLFFIFGFTGKSRNVVPPPLKHIRKVNINYENTIELSNIVKEEPLGDEAEEAEGDQKINGWSFVHPHENI